ncbi:MAG: cell surface protein [Lachnospiraceae bacterium]|nr:cell surface protein [Lachnospiraceae bacterium]
MRYRKYLIISALMLAVCFVLGMKEYVFSEQILRSIDMKFEENYEWKKLIANIINEEGIKLTIDGKQIDTAGMYMNYNRDIMIPASLMVSEFDCSMRIYEDEELVIERNDVKIELKVGTNSMELNGKAVPLASDVTLFEGDIYIPVEVVNKAFQCNYTWDKEENVASIFDTLSKKKYPSRFDYREIGKAPTIGNQGKLGTCWAFASLAAIESTLLPEEVYNFSEDHMSIQNSFSSTQNDGGEYTMSLAYLAAWQGPVYEAHDPYGDGISPEGLDARKHIQEVQILEAKNIEQIKEMVYKYGAVQTSIYTNLKNASSQSDYYNSEKYAYCYIGTDKPNHDVIIIGWDDNYPKENFNIGIEADGAFICQNSWGTNFGEDGVFYISYYDTNIGIHNIVYTGIEEVNNYDSIYQTDLCGWVGQLGYVDEQAYFANVYTAKSREILEAVSFYATDKDTEYEVYFVSDFEDDSSFDRMRLVAEGELDNAGYYTIKLSTEQLLAEGERFAVVVKINTPNAKRPIAVEYVVDESTKDVVIDDGEGYISLLGKRWERTELSQSCNVCLKAFTSKVDAE